MTVITTALPMAMATTSHGGTLMAFSVSDSKYLIRPAAEWKPSPFFSLGMQERIPEVAI